MYHCRGGLEKQTMSIYESVKIATELGERGRKGHATTFFVQLLHEKNKRRSILLYAKILSPHTKNVIVYNKY